MHQSVPNRRVMMWFMLASVAWGKGMNEAPLWHIGFWNMGCKFSIEHVMLQSTLTGGHANGRKTMFLCNSTTSLECLFSYSVHVERLPVSNWPGPLVRSLHSHGGGFAARRSPLKLASKIGCRMWIVMANLNFLNHSSFPVQRSSFEAALVKAGEQGGTCTKRSSALRPSQVD